MAYIETDLPDDMHWDEEGSRSPRKRRRSDLRNERQPRRERRPKRRMGVWLRSFIIGIVLGVIALVALVVIGWNTVSDMFGL